MGIIAWERGDDATAVRSLISLTGQYASLDEARAAVEGMLSGQADVARWMLVAFSVLIALALVLPSNHSTASSPWHTTMLWRGVKQWFTA